MSHQIPHLGKVTKYLRIAITEENRDTFEEVRSATGDNERLIATFLFEEALYTIAEFYRKMARALRGSSV